MFSLKSPKYALIGSKSVKYALYAFIEKIAKICICICAYANA